MHECKGSGGLQIELDSQGCGGEDLATSTQFFSTPTILCPRHASREPKHKDEEVGSNDILNLF